MKVFRVVLALALGAGVTFLLFGAVAALNQARLIHQDDASPEKKTMPLVVSPPPKETKKTPRTPPSARRASTNTPKASAVPIRASVLPALSASKMQLSLDTVLPNLGGVSFGHMEVPEVPVEPDRPARARRAVAPIYPVSAQRDGIEGYVTVRLSIDATGRVQDILVVDSEPIGVFERSARDAARRLEFEPARMGGALAPSTLEKRIVFSLK